MGPYEKILCDANVLYRAYRASIKASKWKQATQKYMLSYLKNIFDLKKAISCRTLKNGPVNEFILMERGKVRPITSICLQDRIVRHAVCDEILMPILEKKLIYDNGSSIKGKGLAHQRARFLAYLHKYYRTYGNKGYILFGDFSKFYDNIDQKIAKEDLLALVNHDEFMDWLLSIIFSGFVLDVSDMTDEEYERAVNGIFDKVEYRLRKKTGIKGKRYLTKSVNFGDQFGIIVGLYYPHRIDTYVKYVCSEKFYGRFVDDWYVMNPDKELLENLLSSVCLIAKEKGIHINMKKTKIVDISKPFKYLQLWYHLQSDGKITIRIDGKKVADVSRKLRKFHKQIQNGKRTYSDAENFFKSWMGAHRKYLTRRQRKSLIALYESLFNVSITIYKKKMYITHNEEMVGTNPGEISA